MKAQWEYNLVERPFCEQLKAMGWQWIEGDKDVPDFTERANFREVLLKGRLATALRKLNLRDGRPWLDDDRIRRIIEKLEKAEGHRLMEVNESATRLLLKGTEIDGLPDWNFGRNQPVRFIDLENPANNDFLLVSQFSVTGAHSATSSFILHPSSLPRSGGHRVEEARCARARGVRREPDALPAAKHQPPQVGKPRAHAFIRRATHGLTVAAGLSNTAARNRRRKMAAAPPGISDVAVRARPDTLFLCG